MKPCVHLLRVVSLFPSVLRSSFMQATLALNTKCSGWRLLLLPDPKPGEPDVGSYASFLGDNLFRFNYPPFCEFPTLRCRS